LHRAFAAAARIVFQPFLQVSHRRRRGSAKGKGKATGSRGARPHIDNKRSAKHEARAHGLKHRARHAKAKRPPDPPNPTPSV